MYDCSKLKLGLIQAYKLDLLSYISISGLAKPLSISPKDEDFKEFIQFQSFRPKILFVYFLLKINFVKSWSFSLEILQLWAWEIPLLR